MVECPSCKLLVLQSTNLMGIEIDIFCQVFFEIWPPCLLSPLLAIPAIPRPAGPNAHSQRLLPKSGLIWRMLRRLFLYGQIETTIGVFCTAIQRAFDHYLVSDKWQEVGGLNRRFYFTRSPSTYSACCHIYRFWQRLPHAAAFYRMLPLIDFFLWCPPPGQTAFFRTVLGTRLGRGFLF